MTAFEKYFKAVNSRNIFVEDVLIFNERYKNGKFPFMFEELNENIFVKNKFIFKTVRTS